MLLNNNFKMNLMIIDKQQKEKRGIKNKENQVKNNKSNIFKRKDMLL